MRNKEALMKVKTALKVIPDFGKLLFRLSRDPRVPRRNKILFGGVAVYLAVPFDIIPDWLPGIGQLDDLVLIALALDSMINNVPKEIIEEHWDGDENALETLREVLSFATMFVPGRIKKRLLGKSSPA